jgi:hypothetical protein
MEINYYIKQISIFREKLDEWDVYLKELYKNVLSSEKSSIRILELNDRKDLIKCEGLEENQLYDELKKIYKVIDQEQIIYKKVCDLILNPKEYSLFSFKSSIKAKRDNEIKTLFKQLFNINEEQKVRVDSFSKSLKLLALEEGQTIELATEKQKPVPVVKTEILQDTSSENQERSVSENKTKPVLKEQEEVLPKKTQEPAVVEQDNDLEDVPDDGLVESNTNTTTNDDDEFDYESEVKRLLGL